MVEIDNSGMCNKSFEVIKVCSISGRFEILIGILCDFFCRFLFHQPKDMPNDKILLLYSDFSWLFSCFWACFS